MSLKELFGSLNESTANNPQKKLELIQKAYSAYLPYKVNTNKGVLVGVDHFECDYKDVCVNHEHNRISNVSSSSYVLSDSVYLHLRPLSDLLKPEIGNNGWWNLKIRSGIISSLSYNSIQDLLKEHYDVFELISQDLAIDINTLNDTDDGE